MKDRLVTLIGGGGFVGRYAAQVLLKAGARLRIAQRDPRGAQYLRTQAALGQVQLVSADVTRPETIARAIDGVDGVVNLAGVFGPEMERVNADGAGAVARACAAAGVSSLVHISAIGADPASASRYGRSKAAGEEQVRAAFPEATILRPSLVFGREDGFTNRFATMISRLPVVPVLRSGTRFQPVYVADVADAVVAALDNPKAFGGQTFELGGPDVLTMGELLRWLAEAIGRDPAFVALPDVAGRALASLGFLPGAPITSDQWRMLERDNVALEDGLTALGVRPTPLDAVAPGWLVRYRRLGRFGTKAAA